jgi:uncharacterized membrane protein YhhN
MGTRRLNESPPFRSYRHYFPLLTFVVYVVLLCVAANGAETNCPVLALLLTVTVGLLFAMMTSSLPDLRTKSPDPTTL